MNIKVVFHIDEMIKWDLLLKNVANTIKEIDMTKSKIQVVAYAEAVNYYLNLQHTDNEYELKKLVDQSVVFVACNNALKSLNINPDDLPEYVTIVPSGVVELIKKQQEGYSYIKP